MRLSTEEQAMLRGDQGAAVQQAMELQVRVGEYFGAADMVGISSVHLSGDVEELGLAGVEHLEKVCSTGAASVVPTLTDPRGVEFHGARLVQDRAAIRIESRTVSAFEKLGFRQCNDCIVYQTSQQPRVGEHLAWGDTGSVIYANSVFGARSNFEAGPAALAASLTGRTPRYGFHLDACRKANVVVHVADQPRELSDWGALGCIVGRQMRGYWDVPVFCGIDAVPGSDELKHLGAALASFGSIAMFHIVGATPEAPDLQACLATDREVREIAVGPGGLREAYASFDASFAPSGKADLVVFSAPQLSVNELALVADAFAGRTLRADVRVFVTAPRAVVSEIEAGGIRKKLESSRVEILTGVCFYLMTPALLREMNGFSRLVTNSAKLANIMGGHGYSVRLRRLADCVQAAVEE